jgi:4-amino-4-deoxy-L-arabinose transferase-like glycosyltransferase
MATSSRGARVGTLPISYRHLVAALLCGLALRLYFIAHFPFYSGDTKFYEELARNWLDHGVYGLFVNGQLMPVDQRMPGYPALLAAIYSVFGRSRIAVMLAQAAIDLVTCVLVALIAARLAPAAKKSLAATIALWLAALCPFTASYTAAIVTETLAAFFTTLALLTLVWIFTEPVLDALCGRTNDALNNASVRQTTLARRLVGAFAAVGFVTGLGTLVRPETPLVLAAAAVVICIRWRRMADWPKLALAGAWLAVGLLAALTPWAARNARTLGRIEFLAPRYAQAMGDFMPRGFYAWTRTWMMRNRDAYTVTWALGKNPIPIDAIPEAAFDSAAERARVADLLASYNSDLKLTPSRDRKFEALAGERAAAHPFRTFALIPIERALATWFAPRVDVLRYSGKLWPIGEQWRANPAEFGAAAIFALLNLVYIGLAAVGAWRYRSNPGCAVLVSYLLIRTALLTQLPTVEPRYVVVCFPVVAALGALAFVKSQQDRLAAARDDSFEASAAYVR